MLKKKLLPIILVSVMMLNFYSVTTIYDTNNLQYSPIDPLFNLSYVVTP